MSRATRKRPPAAKYGVLWAIMADTELSASAKCVATVLLLKYRNHKTGRCNPSFASIAAAVGRTRRPIIAAVQELQARGWIELVGTKGGGRGNTNNIAFCAGPRGETVPPAAPLRRSEKVLPTAPVLSTTERVLQTAHELSRTTSLREEDGEERTPVRAPDGAHEFFPDFEEFWRHYPRQENQKAALAAFGCALAKADAATLINGAMRYAADRDGEDPRYTALPANWLDGERWTDGSKPKVNGSGRPYSRNKKTEMATIALRMVGIDVPEGWQG